MKELLLWGVSEAPKCKKRGTNDLSEVAGGMGALVGILSGFGKGQMYPGNERDSFAVGWTVFDW